MGYIVLVMDDEPLIRRGINQLLDLEKLKIDKVLEAANGQEALSILANHKVDIILSDINTPKMNGLEFAKEVKQNYPHILIAMITGYDYLNYAINALKIGVDDYLLKPVSKKDISALLVKLISQLEDNFKKDFKLSDEDLSHNLRNRLIHEVEKNLSNSDFSLTSLAQTLGYNMSYLSLQFKNLVGENFREFLLDKRLEKARLLLLASDYKIFEISNKVGILDENYFAKCFKKKYGCTCSEFRKQKHDAF